MSWEQVWAWLQTRFQVVVALDVYLLIIAATALVATAWRKLRQARANSWPITQATVQSVGASTVLHGEKRARVLATVAYSYQVNAEYYGGHYEREFADEQDAWDYVTRFEGKTLPLRYHPRNPQHSVVMDSDAAASIQAEPQR